MEPPRASRGSDLLRGILRDVSRSFYLTLRILPGPIRSQIGVAYLLARASDTIADTDAVSVEDRLATLREFQRQLPSLNPQLTLDILGAQQTSSGERVLLDRLNDVFDLLNSLDREDQALVRQVLSTIVAGQELDLLRFGSASENKILALQSDADLDDYTYRVAGCVGEFWTRICLRHLSPRPLAEPKTLVQKGIRLGKGLQLVNILRDLPKDLRQGRCYLPEPALQSVGLSPSSLLDPATETAFRPLYDPWLDKAQDHLLAGWSYVLDLPRSWVRVRLACAWPILIGLETLQKLRLQRVLNPDTRIKVSRSEVSRILRRSVLKYPFSTAWQRLPDNILKSSLKSHRLART